MEGTRLGPYVIDRELGAGGMGTVYRAAGPDGVVALKIVHERLLAGGDATERFEREVEIGKTVRHPNVVSTFDGGEIDGQHYLAMEYVEGQTLAELLAELDRVPEELCRHIGREVSKGLFAIHAAGAIHRDVKPENVLITPDHVVKIMDLGVARSTDDALRLSQTGMFVGSLHYAAPEQVREGGKGLDGRADLHALGLVLYELSSGVNPYRGDDVAQVIRLVLSREPRRLGEINPQLSPFYEEAVHTLLAKDRTERFQSAEELLGILEEGEESVWWRERALEIRAATKRPLRRIRIPRETAVYGREREFALLRSLYARAAGGHGQVVLIGGEAGIGKSRLVDELIGRLRSDGEDMNFLFGSYPPGGAATVAGGFSSAYREHFGGAGSAGFLTQSPLLVPAFDAVLRGEPSPAGVVGLTKDSLGTCFVHATRNLAAERTTIVLIDDLHFAPEEAQTLFSALAVAMRGHRALLVGTARPGVPEDWLANLSSLDHSTHMTLDRLGHKDLASLLEDSFGSAQLAERLAFQIGKKSDGNPFFVFEIIRGLREGQFITERNDGTWVGTRVIEDIQIPSSVLDLVNARVADLTDDERDLLDVACCWGYEFDPALIGEAVGLARISALKRFAQIERRHGLARSAGRMYVFDHHQVQEALYGALNEQLREEYHAALAQALETRTTAAEKDPATLDGALCVDLWEHHLRGAHGGRALRYMDAAVAHLTDGGTPGAAATLCRLALAERPGAVPLDPRSRIRVLARLRGALSQQGRYRAAVGVLSEGLELARELLDDADICHWLLFRGQSRFLSDGVTGEGRADLEEARDLAEAAGDVEAAAAARGVLAEFAVREGRVDEAVRVYRENRRLFESRGNVRWSLTALSKEAGVLRDSGDRAEAGALFERQIALSREIGDRSNEARATGNLGEVLFSLGRLRESREHHERSLALSREIGDRLGEAAALCNVGRALREDGAAARAEESLIAGLAVCEEIGDGQLAAKTHVALGSLRAAAGAEERGRESLAAARDIGSERGFPGLAVLARCHLACLQGGDAQDALAAFAENHERLGRGKRIEACWLLFRATGDRAHLEESKRALDESVAHVDDETRTSMLTNLRLNREILAAWNAELGDGDPSSGEPPTRVA